MPSFFEENKELMAEFEKLVSKAFNNDAEAIRRFHERYDTDNPSYFRHAIKHINDIAVMEIPHDESFRVQIQDFVNKFEQKRREYNEKNRTAEAINVGANIPQSSSASQTPKSQKKSIFNTFLSIVRSDKKKEVPTEEPHVSPVVQNRNFFEENKELMAEFEGLVSKAFNNDAEAIQRFHERYETDDPLTFQRHAIKHINDIAGMGMRNDEPFRNQIQDFIRKFEEKRQEFKQSPEVQPTTKKMR